MISILLTRPGLFSVVVVFVTLVIVISEVPLVTFFRVSSVISVTSVSFRENWPNPETDTPNPAKEVTTKLPIITRRETTSTNPTVCRSISIHLILSDEPGLNHHSHQLVPPPPPPANRSRLAFATFILGSKRRAFLRKISALSFAPSLLYTAAKLL